MRTKFVKICAAVTCPFRWTDHVPFQRITRELHFFELNPAVGFVSYHLVPHWSPISCALPFVGRLGPARAKVGLGFAVAGWFRRFCPSPPPLVLVRFRRPPLFLFPCLFRARPLRARCVDVGVFSLFLLSSFAFPIPCSG